MVLDYHPGGDLGEYLEEEHQFTESRAQIYIAEIILALGKMHSKNVIFRDLKPENIILDKIGHVVVIDFGLAKTNISNRIKGAQSFCGSVAYLAPEMIKKKGHGQSIDWYLLGVLLYEMLTGLPPFYDHDKDQLFENIK